MSVTKTSTSECGSQEQHLEEYKSLFPSDPQKRRELGQFFTPGPVADFMASLFSAERRQIELLDAGAGIGSLTSALVRRLCAARKKPERISVTAYEIDPALQSQLRNVLSQCQKDCADVGITFHSRIFNQDFIEAAIGIIRNDLFSPGLPNFNAAIVNPPYRKIRSDSNTRLLLRSAGIETSNLYTSFLALITKLLADGGEMVAITPRSFCNGPYFRPFRMDFLEAMSLRQLHVFESRSAAFSRDDVLQENLILHAVKEKIKPKNVIISSSSGEADGQIKQRIVSYDDVLIPHDHQQFIHLTVDDMHVRAKALMSRLTGTLGELGINVSTGRVVDFRAKFFLRESPDEATAPLIYSYHFNGGYVDWPKEGFNKPCAILDNQETKNLLVPSGIYVLVKRFSAKEERRRLVASIYDPERVPAKFVGFENHLNYFHAKGEGLSMSLAKGLAAFLNSTVVDVYFRQFSGHTQVNAADLRMLNYPQKAALENLGRKIDDLGIAQEKLDKLVEQELFNEQA